jgi:FeS assembly SUF system protein
MTDEELKGQVIQALRTCYDPEIPVNIYDLGLVYDVAVSGGDVSVRMTLTAPSCPVAGTLPGEVEAKVRSVPGVRNAGVELVWDPPWDRSRMSDAAKLELGLELGFDTVPATRLR